MKKVLSLCIIVFFAGISSIHAQGGGQMDPAQMKEMMKNRYKDAMPYLTPVQLDSVTNIVMDSRSGMRGLRDMSPEDRQAAIKKANEARDKRLDTALPKDVAEKVKKDLAELQQKMMQNGGGRSGGNN